MLTVNGETLSCKIAYMELKDRIKVARESARLTQEQLAKRVGVSRPAVGMWEGGQTKTIEGENLVRTAYVTGVDPLWLAAGEGEMHPASMAKEDHGIVPKKFADAWRQIDSKTREHLIAIAEALAKQAGRYR
jgi:transcriptional regulator with XRE-family HTH domain